MNRTTRTIISIMGAFFAIGGIDHGFFEIQHGNIPTTGLFIQAIAQEDRFWVHGSEDAFTIIPNFLITGILAIMFSLAVMVWLVGFIHTPHGPSIFLLLFIGLFLVGGGVGQVFFFLPAWAVSTRINKPLTWWKKVLPENARGVMAGLWPFSLGTGLLCFLIALEIAIFGLVPGVTNADVKLYVNWAILAGGLVALLFSFVAGFAADIQKQLKVGA